MQELQDRFGLVHSSASRTCTALANAGLVHVSQHSDDRRQSFVRLTARGQRVIDDVLTAFRGQRRWNKYVRYRTYFYANTHANRLRFPL